MIINTMTRGAKVRLSFLVACLSMVLATGVRNKEENRFLWLTWRRERRHHYAWSTEETTVAPGTTTTTTPSLAPTTANPTFHPTPRTSFFRWSILLPVVGITILTLAVHETKWAWFVFQDYEEAAFAKIPNEIQLTPVASIDDELTVDYVGMAQ